MIAFPRVLSSAGVIFQLIVVAFTVTGRKPQLMHFFCVFTQMRSGVRSSLHAIFISIGASSLAPRPGSTSFLQDHRKKNAWFWPWFSGIFGLLAMGCVMVN
jgi:hypothetical protein